MSQNQIARYTDRFHRLPESQRAHTAAKAKARTDAGRSSARDKVFATFAA